MPNTSHQKAIRELNDAMLLNDSGSFDQKEYIQFVQKAATVCTDRFNALGSNFGYFTSHGPDHSARVLHHMITLGNLLETKPLSPRELFVCGLVAYLHDIGMTAPASKETAKLHPNVLMNMRREQHASAIDVMLQECVRTELSDLRNYDQTLYDVLLPLTCKGHSTGEFSASVQELRQKRTLDTGVRYGLIVGLLLFADEMDLDRSRISPTLATMYSEFTTITKAHCWRHWCIQQCYLENTTIRIITSSQRQFAHVEHFSKWATVKLQSQLDKVTETLDPIGESFWSQLSIESLDLDHTDLSEMPDFEESVLDECMHQLEAQDDAGTIGMANPKRLRDTIPNIELSRMRNASDAYSKLIRPYEDVFRGQGMLSTAELVVGTYVEVDQNEQNLVSIVDLLTRRAANVRVRFDNSRPQKPNDASGRLPRLMIDVTGEVGVGKTHMLSILVNRLREFYPDIYQCSCITRVECIDCLTSRDVRERLLYLFIEELSDRLHIYESVKKAMAPLDQVGLPEKKHLCRSLSDEELKLGISNLTRFLGSKECQESLGHCVPLFLFLDNSDHLQNRTLIELYSWLYGLAGDGGAAVLICYRPESYNNIVNYRAPFGDISIRNTPFTVVPPDAREILKQRVKFVSAQRLGQMISPIQLCDCEFLGTSELTITKAQDALTKLAEYFTERENDFLQALAGNNFRIFLVGLLHTLHSWIMRSDDYLLGLAAKSGEPSSSGWPRRLEAFILGRKQWYDSDDSFVGNLLFPPGIKETKAYFLTIHMLQILNHSHEKGSRESLNAAMRMAGYSSAQTAQGASRLAQKVDIYDINMPGNPSPLLVHEHDGRIISNEESQTLKGCTIKTTLWGTYHLSTLLYQLRYWKHILYDCMIPGYIAARLKFEWQDPFVHLRYNLEVLYDYLEGVERSWFANHPEAIDAGCTPVIVEIKERVFRQLAGGNN